ncbi:MAG TPA: hypothetical protein VLY03_10090 [Bacteroidota bacterium]|nr:hypothetical protein [Bacteroidota bacterium]
MNARKFNLLANISILVFFGEVLWSLIISFLTEQATMQQFEWNLIIGTLALFLIGAAVASILRRGTTSRLNSVSLVIAWSFATLLFVTSLLQHVMLVSFRQLFTLIPELALLLSVPVYFIVKKKSGDESSAR